MGAKLNSGYIAAQLNKYLAPHSLDATLIVSTAGVRGSTMSAGTNPSPVSFACVGWVASYETHQIDGTLIKADDREIAILGDSIDGGVIPEPGNKITIDGDTYRIVGSPDGKGVLYNGEKAIYRCHGRK